MDPLSGWIPLYYEFKIGFIAWLAIFDVRGAALGGNWAGGGRKRAARPVRRAVADGSFCPGHVAPHRAR